MALANTLRFLRPGLIIAPDAFSGECVIDNGVVVHWSHGVAEPTAQEIADAEADITVINGQTLSQYVAERGGDPTLTKRREARDEYLDAAEALSVAVRAEMAERNQRDNYILTRLEEIQQVLIDIRDQTNGSQARQNIPGTFPLATATRPRADARQSLRDAIDAGDGDT